MLYDNPNGMHWDNHTAQAKRSNNQTFIGKIVDTIGDGNYKANILQQYSVRIAGWGSVFPNCKVATSQAGHNGTGHYSAYQNGDIVICIAKEGDMSELIIIGGVRLNGNHKSFAAEGQGLKPGELVEGAMGPALTNQASLHPSRVTKPDSEFYLMGVNNIKSEYEDPIFGDELETLADLQPLTGILQSRGRGGVITNYAYGGIINYTDGNNIIVSGGTSENKCTRMLKAAKRHTEFAKLLSTITQVGVEEPDFNIEEAEFGELVDADLNIVNGKTTDSADIVEGLLKGTIQKQSNIPVLGEINENEGLIRNATNVTRLNSGGDFRIDESGVRIPRGEIEQVEGVSGDFELKGFTGNNVVDKAIDNAIDTFKNHPASPLYRQREHLKLADALIEEAKKCNTQAASMQQQAGMMTDQFGNNVGQAGAPGTAGYTGANPNQQNGAVNNGNMAVRDLGGQKPPVKTIPANPNNYTSGRSKPISAIVIHNTVFSHESSINFFKSANGGGTSAHYLISRGGEIVQMVEDKDKAHHAKSANGYSIGIEHEATANLNKGGDVIKVTAGGFTTAMLSSSVSLIKYLMKQYNISATEIVPHKSVVKDTLCPSLLFPNIADFYVWRKKHFGA